MTGGLKPLVNIQRAQLVKFKRAPTVQRPDSSVLILFMKSLSKTKLTRPAGSPPTVAEMETFLIGEWEEDFNMSKILNYGIEVTLVLRLGAAAIRYEVKFFSDPSEFDEKRFKLFDYLEGGFFPTCIQRMTMRERFVWETPEQCDRLTSNYCPEHQDLDVQDLEWDDPEFPDELFSKCVEHFEFFEIGQALVTLYSADTAIPDFVPLRLRPYFLKAIGDYLLWKNDSDSKEGV